MNPLFTQLQLQEIFIEKSYSLFYKSLIKIQDTNLLSKNHKTIFDLLSSHASPEILAKPEIFYWCCEIEKEPTQHATDHLFFEILLILLKLDITPITFNPKTTIISPLVKEPIEKGESTFELFDGKLLINNSKEIELAYTTHGFYFGTYNLLDNHKVINTPNTSQLLTHLKYLPKDAVLSIKTLIKTITVLENISQNQISFSHPQTIGGVYIQETNSIKFCDSLIHETMHIEFDLIKTVTKLIHNSDEEQYYSSVIDKPRPLINCFLALHAFIPLEKYYINVYDDLEDEKAISNLLTLFYKNQELINTLNNQAKFSPEGKEFFDYLVNLHQSVKVIIDYLHTTHKEIAIECQNEVKNHKEMMIQNYPNILC